MGPGNRLRRRDLLFGASACAAIGAPVRAMARGAAAPAEAADKRLGVYKGAGCDGRKALFGFEHWLGRAPGWVIDFLAQESWEEMQNSAAWLLRCWNAAPYRLSLAVPVFPAQRGMTLEAAASGAYDAHYRALARRLVSERRGDAVLRLGWEFNGSWSPWYPGDKVAAFIGSWRRVVGVMRAVPGAAFRFDWNPSLGHAALNPETAYPGDDVVDLIGLDVYNQSWTVPPPGPAARWQELRDQPFGLAWHRDFAQARGKPRSFPEWGTGTRPDGHGGGDDAVFIAGMADWVSAPDVAYHGYWDYKAQDYDALLSGGRFPQAGAEFRRRFGAAAASGRT